MNKKGNLFMLGLMLCVMLFICTVVLLEPIKDVVSIGRTSLSCGDSSLSVYEDMTCIVVGSFLVIFAMAGLGAALGAIGVKKLVFSE